MDADDILEEMRPAVVSDKLCGDVPGWVGGAHDKLVMTLPLDVLATTRATTQLVLRAVRFRSDRDATATLVAMLQGRSYTAWRMDWRPTTPHRNTCGPAHLRRLTMGTGIHEFEHNARLGLGRMQRENLPVCSPVEQEPHDFAAFIRYVCDVLRIMMTDQLVEPPWAPKLF